MNRDREWDFIESFELQQEEDEKSLLATMGIVVRELAIKCPNDQELGKEVRELIKKYKLNTNTNG
jgi:Mor family transcriptional regulator